MNFIIATNNKKKKLQLERILKSLDIHVSTAEDLGIELEDVEETGSTFEENAYLKALSAMQISGLPAVADDSGLMVDALDGAPGLFSARYAGEGAKDCEKVQKLLDNMRGVPEEKRGAKYVCAICCVFPDGSQINVKGECFGKIAFRPKGENGFGYDPVFVMNDGRTFAELSAQEKDAVSHRGEALRRFVVEFSKASNL